MEIKDIIITIIIVFILFEVIEHAVLPLIFALRNRKKKSVSGVNGLVGEVVEVKQWDKTEGQVFVKGELWRAVCDTPLSKGDKAYIQKVKGLTLKVKPFDESVPY